MLVLCDFFLGTFLISAPQNFFRSVRNFVIDVTRVPPSVAATGIHWQVGQATSLINIDFKMSAAAGTKHQGCVCFSSQRCEMEWGIELMGYDFSVFGENGSGGFISDLTFDGYVSSLHRVQSRMADAVSFPGVHSGCGFPANSSRCGTSRSRMRSRPCTSSGTGASHGRISRSRASL